MIDVLVVGGGPVGLATAICCAQRGMSVTVAEPRAAPIDKACGEGVMPAALRRLSALGVDPGGHPLRGIRYLDATHQADALFRHGQGRGVRRITLHAALSERASALGVQMLPIRVTSLTQHPGHVTAAGIQARYLVAADGLHSTIRRALEADESFARCPRHGSSSSTSVLSVVNADSLVSASPVGPARAGGSPGSGARRYGLRRHFQVAPWTDLVEVYWSPHAEAYVTPVADDLVGIAVLFTRSRDDRSPQRVAARAHAPSLAPFLNPSPAARTGQSGSAAPATVASKAVPTAERSGGEFGAILDWFPALVARLGDARPASGVRGAGPLRQDVRRRVCGRVLLVGDASGYLDALTGEGIGVGIAQAEVLAACLAADRPADYERAWRRVSAPAWRLTAGLLWSRNQPLLGSRIVPAAQHLPWLFSTLVNRAANA